MAEGEGPSRMSSVKSNSNPCGIQPSFFFFFFFFEISVLVVRRGAVKFLLRIIRDNYIDSNSHSTEASKYRPTELRIVQPGI
jgi:hypothetical protein